MLKLLKNIDLYSNDSIKNLFCPPKPNYFYSNHRAIKSIFQYPQNSKLRILKVCAQNSDFFGKALEYATEMLDVEAVKQLITNSAEQIRLHALDSLLTHSTEALPYKTRQKLSETEIKERSIEILTTVIPKISQHNLGALSVLSSLISYDDFMKWAKANKINLSQAFYNNFYNSAPYLEVHCPLHPLRTKPLKGEKLNKIDVLLSRTHSKDIDSAQIKQTYNNLLNNNHIEVQDLMSMLLINIANGDTVRIIFTKDSTSFYDMHSNIISVSLTETDTIKIDAIAIHEIAHYVLHKMFDFNALPFSLNSIIFNDFGEIYGAEFDTELDFLESNFLSGFKGLPISKVIKSTRKL